MSSSIKSLLALDLGLTTGWALLTPSGAINSGFEKFKKPSHFESTGTAFLRFRCFLDFLHEQSGGFDACVFEKVYKHKGTIAAHIYGAFLEELKAWADQDHIKLGVVGVDVGKIKKFATDKGNASKKMMIKAVQEKFGHPNVTDDNEADALALLYWALEEGPVQFEIKGVLR